jgi:hypothetical protein
MAENPNTLIVLGSSPDSYFIGYGRRYFAENMPESLTNHAKDDLSVSMTQWIRCARFQLSLLLRLTCLRSGSMSKALDTWVSHNTATGKCAWILFAIRDPQVG